ncbi:MAG: toluene tolerance protein [Gammaproteobacteria bacterium]|nr:toluene tolerance protein [Gammaproteobacteria bacterium]
MRVLSRAAYDALIAGATMLREDLHGPKVYLRPDGRIVKLFRVKRWWSSAMLYPYSLRFKHNAQRLQRRGFVCVSVDETFVCPAIRRHGIVYRRLEGEPLDERLLRVPASDDDFRGYAAFIARLHAQRVYFRSLHPGNVLRLPAGGYGLIDVGDVRFPWLPLSIERRRRNFRHLLRSIEFHDILQRYPAAAFIDAYLAAAQLPAAAGERLAGQLRDDFRLATVA